MEPQQNLLQMPPQRRPLLQVRRQQQAVPARSAPRCRAPARIRSAPSPQTVAAPRPGPAPDRPPAPAASPSTTRPPSTRKPDGRRLRPPPPLEKRLATPSSAPASASPAPLPASGSGNAPRCARGGSRAASSTPHRPSLPSRRWFGLRSVLSGGRVLRLPVQRIVVALVPVMQKTAHREQKLHRLAKLLAVARHRRPRRRPPSSRLPGLAAARKLAPATRTHARRAARRDSP